MDVNSLAHTKWECKYHIVFCTEIPQTGNLQTNKSRCGADIGNTMQKVRNKNHRSRMLPRSYPYAGKDTAEVFCIRNRGIFEGEKFAHDI